MFDLEPFSSDRCRGPGSCVAAARSSCTDLELRGRTATVLENVNWLVRDHAETLLVYSARLGAHILMRRRTKARKRERRGKAARIEEEEKEKEDRMH